MKRYLLVLAICGLAAAQPVFTGAAIFPPEEFASRRARVMEKIGDGAAIVLGATEPPGEMPLRQGNQFFYVSGVVEPRAILVIDGKSKRSTLFLNPRNVQRESSMYGPGLSPGEDAAKATGIDAVLPRSDFQAMVDSFSSEGRAIYTPFRPEVLGSISSGDPDRLWAANKSDPWDGRTSREQAFIAHLQERAPNCDVRNLDPILDAMRGIKSPREIAVIREATRIAGLGIMEAMRDAQPGMFEYELQADSEFVFKKYGAFGAAYFALIGAGPNTYYTHYHGNTAKLQDGDLVQFDYAPDYKYYQSDVTRVFPVNSKFTPREREYYDIYLRLYRAVMTSIKVHAFPRDVIKDAVVKMDGIMAGYKFADDKIKIAAQKFVENYRRQEARATSLGHSVGMEVHDVRMPTDTLEPGEIFTIEPEMRIEEDHLGMRLEDMLLITETGYENLSSFVPIEIADIEKLMADRKHGLSAAHSTLPGK
jgi:Xaa-Pro aminopeptidase